MPGRHQVQEAGREVSRGGQQGVGGSRGWAAGGDRNLCPWGMEALDGSAGGRRHTQGKAGGVCTHTPPSRALLGTLTPHVNPPTQAMPSGEWALLGLAGRSLPGPRLSPPLAGGGPGHPPTASFSLHQKKRDLSS